MSLSVNTNKNTNPSCSEDIIAVVFLVVVCKSRSGIHFKLLKSDNICNFYTNLNIEKIGSCFGGKTIITDIWQKGIFRFIVLREKKYVHRSFFTILPSFQYMSNKQQNEVGYSMRFWKVEIYNYQNLVQFSFSPAFRQHISSMLHLFRQYFLTYAI